MDDVTAALAALSSRLKSIERELERARPKSTSALTLIDLKAASAGAVASFDFQNIPGTYSKLILDLYARGDTAATSVGVNLTFNNDGSSIYDYVQDSVGHSAVLATAEGLSGTSIRIGSIAAASAPASAFDGFRVEVPGYAITNGHKVLTSVGTTKKAATTGNILIIQASGWYRSTNAISRITFTPSAGNFAQYSTARLYGVA
jgi:hypothetical protein